MSTLLAELESDFSRIRIRERGRIRELIFLRQGDQEVVETAMDLDAPHRLLLPYYRWMFAGLVLQPRQDHCLLLGLGGGTMVRFLRRERPEALIDAVEIDPVVVRIAEEFFETRGSERLRIFVRDGAEFLRETSERYDAVYVDAYLRPGPATDLTGAPLQLSTRTFCEDVARVLGDDGVAAFNLIRKGGDPEALRSIESCFAHVYPFPVPTRLNTVVIASPRRFAEDRLRRADEFARGLR